MVHFARSLAVVAACALLCQLGLAVQPADQIVKVSVDRLVDSLPHSRRRGLQQSTEDGSEASSASRLKRDCVWNPNSDKCVVNPLVALGLLQKAPESNFKDMIFGTVECHFKETKDACVKTNNCKWDKNHDVCEFVVDITEIDHFKRCLGEAALFLQYEAKSRACETAYDTKDSCDISRDCGWDAPTESCSFDILKVLTGVPSMETVPKGIDKILQARAEAIGEAIDEEPFESLEEIKDWEMPPFACPDGVDQVICHVAETGDEYLMAEILCATQHNSSESCNADDRCVFDDTIEDEALQCRISKKLETEAKEKQREAYISKISSPMAVAILRQEFLCNDASKKECKGNCGWNEKSKICAATTAFVVQEIARQPVPDKSDSTCRLVKGMFASGCLELDKAECRKMNSRECIWDSSDGFCVPGSLALTDILFEDDKKLKAQSRKLYDQCHSIEAKSDCL